MNNELHYFGDETNGSYRSRVKNALTSFLTDNNLQFVVGISGGSDGLSQRETVTMISEFIEGILDTRCAILTGGTQGGIPELGVKIAKASSIPTIGIFPSKGRNYALFPELDLAIETTDPTIGEGTFGSESPSFVNLLDGATVIGGSHGTLVEVATILKINKSRLGKNQKPIFLCPILGTGGVADAIATLPDIDVVSTSLPNIEIRNGKQAATFLKGKLHG